ncbi:MAG: hypothetical protein JRD43_06990 [Deltaproteobacteria bacterium]|nr:hypothetical protein [Deltaproteobacteria bacterium]
MLEDENLDIVAPMFIPPQDKDDPVGFLNESYMSLIDTAEKPVVPIVFREMTDYAGEYLRDRGLYFMEDPDTGFKAVSHLIEYAGFIRRFREGSSSASCC